MSTPETKLTVETTDGAYQPDSLLSFNHANREVLRITHDGHIICGEGLSTEEATQEAAKLLIASFEKEIQKMLDARAAAELVAMTARAEKAEAAIATMTTELGKMFLSAAKRADGNVELRRRAEKAEAELAKAREKVRVLREALERRHTEQGYHRQYVDDALAATEEASK